MSRHGPASGPANAIDGNFGNLYHSKGDYEPYLVVDLGVRQQILKTKITTRKWTGANVIHEDRFHGIEASIK